jgi:hypothetical protein
MRILARIGVGHGEVEASLEERLRSVFPEQTAPRGFRSMAPVDDERTREVIALLENAGLRPWDFTRGVPLRQGSEYWLRLEREYEVADLATCEYLEIFPTGKAVHLEAHSRTDSGRIILPKWKAPRGFDIMITHLHVAYFATERAKSILEGAGLQHVHFRPACYGPYRLQEGDTEDSIAARYGRPYWEVDSQFTLPPLSPSLRLTDADGKPWTRDDFSNGLQPREGLFLHPELRYRRSDLERLEPFDLARTYEPFGNFRSYDRLDCPLIASRRFYEVCAANKLKTDWVPVRIDPE